MRLSDEDLRGRTIITADGQVLGEIAALLFESDAWRIESLRAKLGSDIADQLGADRGMFHAGRIEIPIRMVQSVGDTIVLSVPVDGLRKALPKDTPVKVEDAPATGPASSRLKRDGKDVEPEQETGAGLMNEDRDVSNFEKLATKTKERLIASKDKSMEWLHSAIDASAEQLEKAGDFTREEGKRASSYLKRDLAATRVDFVRARESISRGVSPSRVSAGFVSLAAHLLGSTGDMFRGWATRSEVALACSAGEISGPGRLTCTHCGTELNLERSDRIPPCAKCQQTAFRKSY
jgi:sporulation protein YlmC with PRC-barrel domain